MSQLRSYQVLSRAIDRSNGIFPALAVSGNFYYVRNVRTNNTPIASDFDVAVNFSFDDDQGNLQARSGEGGSRLYQRLQIKPVVPDTDLNDYIMTVVLGEGSLYSDRPDIVVPSKMNCFSQVIPAGVATKWLFADDLKPAIKEIRMNIRGDANNGMTYGGDNTVSATQGAWLEKGIVEFLDYAGDLWFFNNGATAVAINFAVILRNDY